MLYLKVASWTTYIFFFLTFKETTKNRGTVFFLPVPTVEGVSFLLPTHSFSLKSVGGDPMEMGTLQPWAKVKSLAGEIEFLFPHLAKGATSGNPIGVKLRRREEKLKGDRAGGDRKFLL